MMTLSRVRESINAAYSDRFVESVIQQFPKHLRYARLKGGKEGVARIPLEQNIEEEG